MSSFDEHPIQDTPIGSVDPQLLPPRANAYLPIALTYPDSFSVVPAPPRDPLWSGWDVLLLTFATVLALGRR